MLRTSILFEKDLLPGVKSKVEFCQQDQKQTIEQKPGSPTPLLVLASKPVIYLSAEFYFIHRSYISYEYTYTYRVRLAAPLAARGCLAARVDKLKSKNLTSVDKNRAASFGCYSFFLCVPRQRGIFEISNDRMENQRSRLHRVLELHVSISWLPVVSFLLLGMVPD
ncbi:hypothetical protein BHE74_00013133 [Ensete ventricosum]|nr:hypothetical protein GW17_00051864 [Ensete ventricosum]RWW78633.1 hypothetical protein BHE74_00013133 [Ensete ventricosum]